MSNKITYIPNVNNPNLREINEGTQSNINNPKKKQFLQITRNI